MTTANFAERNTRAAIARIHKLDRRINAVLAVDPTAIAQARALDRLPVSSRGPLFGTPVLVKDNIESKGPLPTTAGSLALKENVTGRDASLVAKLRQAGVVILGKTNLSEWANFRSNYAISGWSAIGGQTRNPHALDRNPCGSSSGSAAAVAQGMVDAAIGTETDGSITCPASTNGVVGFKPTVGLVSRTHVIPISSSQDTPGPLAKDVTTAARLLSAMAGSDPADPATALADARRRDYGALLRSDALRGQRIGVLRSDGWSPPVLSLFERALSVLRAQGATLVEVSNPGDTGKLRADEFAVLLTEFKAGLNAYLATTPPAVRTRSLSDLIAFNEAHAQRELSLFGQDLFVQAQQTRGLGDGRYQEARSRSRAMAGPKGIDAILATNSLAALIAPTAAPAWKTDIVNGDHSTGDGAGYLAAIAGYPHLSVPMGAVRGLPVGLSFIGAAWSDAELLGLGYAYEQAARVTVRPSSRCSVEPLVTGCVAPYRGALDD
jgi:amidase